MKKGFSLALKDNGRTVFPLDKHELTLGRSSDCDIELNDPYVSRKQARIVVEQGQAFIESLGRNPVQVNGEQIQKAQLLPGHVIQIGISKLVVQAVDDSTTEELRASREGTTSDEQTVSMPASLKKDISGPHLVLSDAASGIKNIPLDKDVLNIGRETDNDLQLDDPAVSRLHARIASKKEGFLLTNLSEVNPVQVNAQPVSSKRLFSGDRILIGPFFLTFASDRKQDRGPIQEGLGLLSVYHLGALAVLVLVVLVLGGYFVYSGLYKPWTYDRSIKSASVMIESGNQREAVDRLETLLDDNLSREQMNSVYGLLADAVLSISNDLIEKKEVKKAKSLLMTFIGQYGRSVSARPVAERLDQLRLEIGRSHESKEEYHMALKEYAAVSDSGPLADDARAGIRRIWLAFQQAHLDKKSVAELLKQAERNFIAKRYLTPVNKNAYAIYTSVLSIDPDNAIALKRIEQMKTFYEQNGKRHFQAGRFQRALTYFERYAIIDPDNQAINAKIKVSRSKLGSRTADVSETKTQASRPLDSEYEKQVEKLLRDSGTEGSRIMKYLFEDAAGEQGTEKPW